MPSEPQTVFESASRANPELEKMAAAPAGADLDPVTLAQAAPTMPAWLSACRESIVSDPGLAIGVAVLAGFLAGQALYPTQR